MQIEKKVNRIYYMIYIQSSISDLEEKETML